MRGTGFDSILVTKDASVGVVVDDFAFNHTQAQSVAMFDVEQIEMFRVLRELYLVKILLVVLST